MADPMLAQSAVDRVVNSAYELVLEGESYRSRQEPRETVMTVVLPVRDIAGDGSSVQPDHHHCFSVTIAQREIAGREQKVEAAVGPSPVVVLFEQSDLPCRRDQTKPRPH